jgi:glycine hydroxymethyltransferase
MTALAHRAWVPQACEARVQQIAAPVGASNSDALAARIADLIATNRQIHEQQCFNLNPATNVMNPKAEAALAAGLGSRPSLGYPGDKYEMGLEAIEEIEVIAAELCAEIFAAEFAEIRVGSGALANLYAFMATCKPGDSIIVPPADIGGHVTHHADGAAGLYGVTIHPAPIAANGYTVDLEALRVLAHQVRPKLITIGGSLNLYPHPMADIRAIADEVDAKVLFDAAHQCGIIAGAQWPNPLAQGAHMMTMSTYKSLGGPAGGLIVSSDAGLAKRLDAIAFPGLTANFDAAKSAALAITMLDWRDFGRDYAHTMVTTASALAQALDNAGLPVFACAEGFTSSHQFAIKAAPYGGGQAASKRLREHGFLACGIGLPLPAVANDMNGLRIGTPELVRWGFKPEHCEQLASLIAAALQAKAPAKLAAEVAAWRETFNQLHFMHT